MRPSSLIDIQHSRETDKSTARRLLLYVASPMATYQTPRYDQMLAHARQHFQDGNLMPARDLYSSNAHWQATWPQHLKRIDGVVFFTDTDLTIGKGVVAELSDALRRGVPIHYLQDDGSLLPYKQVAVEVLDGGASWRKYARVQVNSDRSTQERPTENTQKDGHHVAP
jgi:hypothetical protein